MAVGCHLYTKLALSLGNKLVDFDTDVIKCALFTAYTLSTGQDGDQFMTAAKARGTECTNSNGYVTGGATVTTVTPSVSGHVYTLDCDDVVWAALNQSPLFAIFYDSSPGADATNPVIAYWDFGGAVSPGGQQFTLQIAAGGLGTWTVA